MISELKDLSERLKLSQGDLLGLAREVAQDAKLRCVEDLTLWQHCQLLELLSFLARPITIRLPPGFEEEHCTANYCA
jgi:hypothetical protein